MTIREAGKGIVKSTGGTYQIGFTDLYGEEHETDAVLTACKFRTQGAPKFF